MLVRLLAILSTVALAGGTAVGHPVPTKNAVGTGLTYTSGALPVASIVYDRCDGTFLTDTIDETLDPVANDPITMPVGYTCGLEIVLSDRFLLSGSGTAGGTFALSLGVGTIEIPIDPPIHVPEDQGSGGTWIRFAAPDWVTADLLDLDPNEHVSVGATHTLHDQLRDAVRYDSAAW